MPYATHQKDYNGGNYSQKSITLHLYTPRVHIILLLSVQVTLLEFPRELVKDINMNLIHSNNKCTKFVYQTKA